MIGRFVIRDFCFFFGKVSFFNKEWKLSELLINLFFLIEFIISVVN